MLPKRIPPTLPNDSGAENTVEVYLKCLSKTLCPYELNYAPLIQVFTIRIF